MPDKALLLHSDYTGELKNCKVKDGSIIIDDKEFFVDDIRPIVIKSFFGTKNLYILKWRSIRPLKLINKKVIVKGKSIKDKFKSKKSNFIVKMRTTDDNYIEFVTDSDALKFDLDDNEDYVISELDVIEPKFDEKSKVLPKLLKSTIDMRFLSQMKKYAEEKKKIGGLSKGIIMILGFAIPFIIALLYSLSYYGII